MLSLMGAVDQDRYRGGFLGTMLGKALDKMSGTETPALNENDFELEDPRSDFTKRGIESFIRG
jgi:hypothetical protein